MHLLIGTHFALPQARGAVMKKSTIAMSLCSFLVGVTFSSGQAWAALAGQENTCGSGTQNRVVRLKAEEKIVDLGESITTEAWTFNGTTPGPTIEACEGDSIKIIVENKGKMAHGFDSHAFRTDPMHFGPVDPGKTMVSENGVYGEPNQKGRISPSGDRMNDNRAYIILYNGSMKHAALDVRAGDLVRVYFVNAGPYTSAFHVMGIILDKAYEGGNPRNVASDTQTYGVPAGSGGMFEFVIPEKGTYMLVDHDKLSQIPNPLAIPIVAREAVAAKTSTLSKVAH